MMKPIRFVLSPTRSRPVNIFLGLVVLVAAVLLLLSLVTYRASDPSLNTASDPALPHAVRNWVGVVGANTSDLLLQALGVTAFLLPLWLAGLGITWARSRAGGSSIVRWAGTLVALIFVPTAFGLLPWNWHWPQEMAVEGVVGKLVSGLLVHYVAVQGAWVITSILALSGLYFASAVTLRTIWESMEDRWLNALSFHDRWQIWRDRRAEDREMRQAMRAAERAEARGLGRKSQTAFASGSRRDNQDDHQSEDQDDDHPQQVHQKPPSRLAALFTRKPKEEESDLEDQPAFQRIRFESDPVPPQQPYSEEADPDLVNELQEPIPVNRRDRTSSIWERGTPEPAPVSAPPAPTPRPAQAVPPRAPEPAYQPMPRPVATPPAAAPWMEPMSPAPVPPAAAPRRMDPSPAVNERADAELRTATVAPKNVAGYKLPPSTLLIPGEGPQAVREEELREEAKVLENKCAEFDVRGRVVQINPGPMVTTYEFKPDAGVKYSRVTGLADDLCLALRAESILIERMAGKSTVGIQVPNHEKETIHLRDVIESETFTKAKSRLTLAMGKDINGRIVTADLASMPHVLIAGSTGSGKSVAINAMIMSLLYRTTPQQVRLILVDPKRVELGMYEGIPHLFTPIITEPKAAANVLRNAVCEMERRLKLLASRSVRNLDQYNRLFEASALPLFGPEDDEEEEGPLPYIVIIIDELADLMMLDRANVEESITRLAQMARAVGIHLILATQRPSVDVITGLIKANVPTRISFRLATKVDSRTILDTNGAESLLGRGDMLFLPPGTSRLMRLHAPYVSEKETAAVVGFWKAQGEAEYVEGFTDSPKDERTSFEGAGGEEDNDPLFDDAVRLVFEFGKASTSLLQRRLRVGYGRAAHLIDMMEMDGLVGPSSGSKPRDLLKQPGWLHEVPSQDE
jgi:S-DNA-T family DNA segregation ATPase FtsK/SpoIIIE